jgi:hypothetical protein
VYRHSSTISSTEVEVATQFLILAVSDIMNKPSRISIPQPPANVADNKKKD